MATFGLTTEGSSGRSGSGFNAGTGGVYVCRFQAPANGTITSISVDCYYGLGYTLLPVVYSDNNGVPGSLLAVGTTPVTPTSAFPTGFTELPSISCPIVANQYYWLGFIEEGSCWVTDSPSTSAQTAFAGYNSYPNPPATFVNNNMNGSPWNVTLAIYATYTPSGLNVSVSPTSASVVVGESETFTATAAGGSGSYSSYDWYEAQASGNVLLGTGNPITVPFQVAGSYNVFVVVTDSSGATAQSSNVPVTVTSVTSTVPASMALTVSGSKIYNANGQVVNLHGVGIALEIPDLIFWATGGSDSWADQWTPITSAAYADTFAELANTWHVNMVRMFFNAEWLWNGTVNENVSGAGFPSNVINVIAFLQQLANIAGQYGIYLDICLGRLTTSAPSDPYYQPNATGIPMANSWDSVSASFIAAQGYAGNEAGFWTAFWSKMANQFKNFPNIIFEAWNEPATTIGSSSLTIPSYYITYLTLMYNAIRGAGASNLIFTMWGGGLPGQSLQFAGQVNAALNNPTNMAYNIHIYYYAPYDLTPSWNQNGVDSSQGGVPMTSTQITAALQAMINSMGVTAPLIVNEQGDCRNASSNLNNDYVWWQNLLTAEVALGIGTCAFYWLSDSGLGPVYDGNNILSSDYTPNTLGTDYINAIAAIPASSLDVVAGANGSVSPSGTASYIIGQSYQFTATPAVGYVLDHWDLNGTSMGSSNPLSLTITAAMNGETLTALFTAAAPQTVTVTIAVSGNGSTSLTAGQHTFNVGDTVGITATPNTGSTFQQWTLDGTTYTANPLSLSVTAGMNGQTLTAVFVTPTPTFALDLPTAAAVAVGITDAALIAYGLAFLIGLV